MYDNPNKDCCKRFLGMSIELDEEVVSEFEEVEMAQFDTNEVPPNEEENKIKDLLEVSL